MEDNQTIKEIIVLEENIEVTNIIGMNNGNNNFKMLNEITPIFLSAPHAVK